MLDCFRFQIQISHFSVDGGLFQVLDPDYSTSVTLLWMLDCFRFQIQISHFSVDVGLVQVLDPDQSL